MKIPDITRRIEIAAKAQALHEALIQQEFEQSEIAVMASSIMALALTTLTPIERVAIMVGIVSTCRKAGLPFDIAPEQHP